MKTVYIADDQSLFRKGMVRLLSTFKGVSKVKEAKDGKELIQLVKSAPPDVVLMDYKMPVMDGAKASKYILNHFESVKILMLSMNDEERFIFEMMELGVHGYLLKNAEPEEVENAIEIVTEKDFYYNQLVTDVLRKGIQYRNKKAPHQANSILTLREKEILVLICQELTAKEIAEKLSISERTVNSHRANLIEKIGARNTVGLVRYALESNLLK